MIAIEAISAHRWSGVQASTQGLYPLGIDLKTPGLLIQRANVHSPPLGLHGIGRSEAGRGHATWDKV
jgi:hypothetical protein